MKKPFYSIILPIHNQEEQIKGIINQYFYGLKKLKDAFELILVINGSKDRSYALAKKNNPNAKIISVFNLKKSGWGRAVKFGLLKAKGDYICYTNSARTDINDLLLILKYAKVNDNVVVKATRIIRENPIRKLGSILYNLENRLLFRVPVWDVNGTPKVIPKKILSKFSFDSDDDLIDAELMAKCFLSSFSIIEIPIRSTKRLSGISTTNIKSALKMYLGLLKLKARLESPNRKC